MKTYYFLYSDEREAYLGVVEGYYDYVYETARFERCVLFRTKEGAKRFLENNFEFVGKYSVYSCTISDIKLED